jgi:hypothetical protein
MTGSNLLRIAGIAIIISIFIFLAIGPGAGDFRALLSLVFNFVAIIAWPLAAVLIVLILRKPLSDLIGKVGQAHAATPAPSRESSETASKPD